MTYTTSDKFLNEFRRQKKPRLGRLFKGLLLGLCYLTLSVSSQATDLSEKLKAVYIANIAKFVTWPSTEKEITLCLYSNANIHVQSVSLNDLPIGGHRHLRVISNPIDYSSCNMMYWDIHSIQHRNKPPNPYLLEISDLPNALVLGMDVQLRVEDNKMRFSIAYSRLEKSYFSISSKLLRLSKDRSKP